MKNKVIIGVAAAAVVVIAAVIVLFAVNGEPETKTEASPSPEVAVSASPEASAPAENDSAAEQTAAPAEEKVYTPTFMYFVSDSDEGYDATMVTVDELKAEYKDKINFDIRNIDDEPELVEKFPVGDGKTPVLIMLNTKNEISNILFNTSDKTKLAETIEAAMK